jgi:Fe-S-cluster containining protein
VTDKRCSGHCCKCFPLLLTPEELDWRQESFQDGPQINEMVIHLGRFPNQRTGVEFDHYTCKYHLPSGDCGIYEHRPRMCRDHPHYNRGASCDYTECTYANQEAKFVGILRKAQDAEKVSATTHTEQ